MEPNDEKRKTHQANLLEKLNRDRLEGNLTCDLTLKSEGKAISVHKSILMVSSEFFKNMFTVEMMERYSDDIEMQIPHQRLVNIIDFIYTGRIEITEENVMDVLGDAEYTQILDLKELCSKFLLQSAATVQNCLKTRAYAQRYHLNAVIEKCNSVIRNNFECVMNHQDLMELDYEDFSTVVKFKTLKDEESAFKAIVRWVNHNIAKREELFADLFSLLNLDSLNHQSLSTLSQERLLKESLICSNMLIDAFVNVNATEKILLIGRGVEEVECALFDFKNKSSKKVVCLLNKRKGPSSVRIENNLVYVFGGAGKSCEMLNLVSMQYWNELPNMLEERTWCDAVSINDLIFVTGGWNCIKKVLYTCEVFDINNRKWSRISNMQQKRCFHKNIVCQGLLYCIGGFDGENRLTSCEWYDETQKRWKNAARLIEERSNFACVEFDGAIYAIGGINTKVLSSVEKYVPATNEWTNVAALKSARTECFACVMRGKITVMGGRNDSDQNLQSVEVYDPQKDVWETLFELDYPLAAASIVAV